MTKRAPDRMPSVFVGHGSPMNAIEDNEFRRGWARLAARLPRPKAVLCASAHWETRDRVSVTAAERPETIHDFYGFPKELFAVRYPAPGLPSLARTVVDLAGGNTIDLDAGRGLDHGAWSVLAAMYPEADVPVVQLSLDTSRPASFHLALAERLAPLRDQGVLVLGSGNMVHNLAVIDFHNPGGYDWAIRVGDAMRRRIVAGDLAGLADYRSLGPEARLAVPTPEHFLPLLYALALRAPDDDLAIFNDRTVMGSIAMTSFVLGGGAP